MIEIVVSLAVVWVLSIVSYVTAKHFNAKKHSSDFIFEMDKKIFALSEELKKEIIDSTQRYDYLAKKVKEMTEKSKEAGKIVEEAKSVINATSIARGFTQTKRTGFGN